MVETGIGLRGTAGWVMVLALITLAAVGGIAGGPAAAARDPAAVSAVARTEILVYEDPASQICQVFRARIVPGFRASVRGTKVPMRFIDITSMASDTPGLVDPISIVPTAVIMQDGREVGRIVGYWGPEAFGQMIGAALNSGE